MKLKIKNEKLKIQMKNQKLTVTESALRICLNNFNPTIQSIKSKLNK